MSSKYHQVEVHFTKIATVGLRGWLLIVLTQENHKCQLKKGPILLLHSKMSVRI